MIDPVTARDLAARLELHGLMCWLCAVVSIFAVLIVQIAAGAWWGVLTAVICATLFSALNARLARRSARHALAEQEVR